MVVRYIGDTHLYYSESQSWRPMSFDEYANDLVINWELTRVLDDDLTIMVGDIGDYCARTVEVLKSLRGMKILVLGNHDLSWPTTALDYLFDSVYPEIRQGNMLIRHVPTDADAIGSYVIHGHHHEYVTPSMLNQQTRYLSDRMRFNCAADIIGNKPCTFNQLMINKEHMRKSVLHS